MGDHYIPQMLLRNFCDGNGLLWVARKDAGPPFQGSPRNVFAVNNLNTKQTPIANADQTGWIFQPDRSPERILSKIESRAAGPIRQVIGTAREERLPELSSDARDALKHFFFSIARRTPESQRRFRTPEPEARHELYIRLSRMAENQGVALPCEDDFYADPAIRELIDYMFHNADASMAAGTIPSVRRYLDQFFKNRYLAVVVITQCKSRFILGSHGIAIIQGMPPGSWLPIAPDVAIAYHDDHQHEKISFLGTEHDKVIRAINLASASNSTMIAGNPRRLIARMMKRAWGGRSNLRR